MNPDPSNSSPDSAQPPASPAPPAPERFTLPTSSRPASLPGQVLAADARSSSVPLSEADKVAEEAAIAGVRQREARARLLALRRIEWVAIGLATVLLGGAAWSWRTRSDSDEKLREAFRGAPLPFDAPGNPRSGRPGRAASWRAARPGEIKAASQAIRSQLDAFKRDDYEAAAVWQSQGLRRRWGSVSAFRRAIRENYPAFTAYRSVRFGLAQALPDGAALRIIARLRGPRDESIPAEYVLVREGTAYRIDGVSTPRPRDVPRNAPKGAKTSPPSAEV